MIYKLLRLGHFVWIGIRILSFSQYSTFFSTISGGLITSILV